MRVVVTGAGGFIGGAVARQLRARGDDVVAIVRDPARTTALDNLGVKLVQGDLSSADEIARVATGTDAVVHVAGSYRTGILPADRPAMEDANVGTTTRVLDGAIAAGMPRIVYTSTVNVFGNTHGVIVDESYQRDLNEGFLTWYDETKYRAHLVAEERISRGAPVVIAMPSGVYGPGDHSEAGEQVTLAHAGRLPYLALADCGIAWVYVDDVATGIVQVLDGGRLGERYILSGAALRLRDGIVIGARLGGKRLPRFTMPTAVLRALVPINRRFGAVIGMPPNLAETIRSADGVTYWASAAKAERELGFQARDLESGLRATFGA